MALKIGQKLKNLVGKVAPMVGTAIGGPFGGIAGKFVQDALGVDSEAAAMDMLEADPEAVLKLKTAEMQFKQFMRDAEIREEQLHAEDRQSARTMASSTSIVPQAIMSAVFIVGYFVIVGLFFSDQLAIPMGDAFYLLVGVLTAAIPQILAFWFGSSSGSKEKTAKLGPSQG